jgi:dihydroxyacetone kinase-like protein
MALSPCTVPQAGKPTFELGPDEMEMGMGIHGEPGLWRCKLKPADALADDMIEILLRDRDIDKNGRFSVMVNRLGATPLEELYIVFRRIRERLAGKGCEVVMPIVGRLATSMEMAGMTLTICHLDKEL